MANQLKAIRINVTTDASGDGSTVVTPSILGWLVGVRWIDGTYDDGVDGTLTAVIAPSGVDDTLFTLTNANTDAMSYPRATECSTVGAALTTTTMMIIDGSLKLTVAQGGNVKTGGCIVYYTDR